MNKKKSLYIHAFKIYREEAVGLKSSNYALLKITEKVYFGSQILERPSIGEYWNISGVPVLPENVII